MRRRILLLGPPEPFHAPGTPGVANANTIRYPFPFYVELLGELQAARSTVPLSAPTDLLLVIHADAGANRHQPQA